MYLLIESKNLIDFPYDPFNPTYHQLFSFKDDQVGNLVSEITYASPTCYLVSGYRGSGKTSFIKRVQQKCNELAMANAGKASGKRVVFVYSSFSRYESQTYFLRQIIRDLKETVTDNAAMAGESIDTLDDLYDSTFNAVKKEREKIYEKNASAEFSMDSKAFLQKIAWAASPILLPYLVEVLAMPLFKYITWPAFPSIKAGLYFAAIFWGIAKLINFSAKYSIKQTSTTKNTRTNLSDDNITSYFLDQVITKFDEKGYKLVFVLDELDKVDDEDLDKLLKEMKPWLVRGKADFIIVAGQKLTLKYYQLKEQDDEMMASLFSKIIHIGLMPEHRYTKLFNDFLLKGATESADIIKHIPYEKLISPEKDIITRVCNSYVYKSKCLPRTFMNLLRQDIIWKGETALLPVTESQFELEQLKMTILKKQLSSLDLNADIPETVKGHISMQLFRVAGLITKENRPFLSMLTITEFIFGKLDGPSTVYPYPQLEETLKLCILDFYQKAVDVGLINKAMEKKNAVPAVSENMILQYKPDPSKLFGEGDALFELFKSDFLTFISILDGLNKELHPTQTFMEEEVLFVDLLQRFHEMGFIKYNGDYTALFEKPVRFYYENRGDNDLFKNIYKHLEKDSVYILHLIDQLIEHYTLRKMNDIVGSIENVEMIGFLKNERSNISQFRLNKTNSNKSFSLLMDYKFVYGEVEVGSEEITRIINILDDFNLSEDTGNYFISIIFYLSHQGKDAEKINLSATLALETARKDLKDRVFFLIINVGSYLRLQSQLREVRPKLKPYSPKPIYRSRVPNKKSIKYVKDNLQKGKWGGLSKANGRVLSAHVDRDSEDKDWYYVNLKVTSTEPETNPLTGKVTFHLHPEFSPSQFTVLVKNGLAELRDLRSHEAFTVGASADNNTTKLELDLNGLTNLPDGFGY